MLGPAAVFMSACAVASGDDEVSRHSTELIFPRFAHTSPLLSQLLFTHKYQKEKEKKRILLACPRADFRNATARFVLMILHFLAIYIYILCI